MWNLTLIAIGCRSGDTELNSCKGHFLVFSVYENKGRWWAVWWEKTNKWFCVWKTYNFQWKQTKWAGWGGGQRQVEAQLRWQLYYDILFREDQRLSSMELLPLKSNLPGYLNSFPSIVLWGKFCPSLGMRRTLHTVSQTCCWKAQIKTITSSKYEGR